MGRKKTAGEEPRENEGRAKIPVALRMRREDHERLRGVLDALPAHGRSLQSVLEDAALKALKDLEAEYQQLYHKPYRG